MECAGGAQQVAPATQSNQAVNLGQFPALLSINGYVTVPVVVAGVKQNWIIQQGVAASNSSGVATLTLPITFPNALLRGFANYVNNGTGVASVGAAISNSSTNSQLIAVAQNAGAAVNGAQVNFLAIGW
jgi:hypothetical protein